MKKSLEAELMSIAHKILKMRDRSNVHELKEEARLVYEKLAVLAFAEDHFEGAKPTIGQKQVEEALMETEEEDFIAIDIEDPINADQEPEAESKDEVKVEDNIEGDQTHEADTDQDDVTEDEDPHFKDGTLFNQEGLIEPNTEKIKDIVAQMPPEGQQVDDMLDEILPQETFEKRDFAANVGVDYDNMPVFEPVDEQAKSVNDTFKHGLDIGLNDRLAFITHLFDGKEEEYKKTMNLIDSYTDQKEAHNLIKVIIKPQYNHWEGKESYEERLIEIVDRKFDQ
ncbi:hypothetical protein GCM10009117_18380 [Gangjinia marincola]|uniref:Uncharacterized protein n=1 Tax=Gangjinia marincola TaxID=578463 RepID=A0ABP3XXG5_9FLAO